MASSLKLLKMYGSDSDNESATSNDSTNEDKDETVKVYRPIDSSLSLISTINVDSAPLVLYSVKF